MRRPPLLRDQGAARARSGDPRRWARRQGASISQPRTRPWRAQTQTIGRLTGSRASNGAWDFDANPPAPRYRPRVILDSAAARCGCCLRGCVLAAARPMARTGRRAESDQVEPDVSGIPRVAGWNSSIDLLRVTRRVVAHWIRTVRTGVAKRFAIFLVSERAAVVRVVALLHVANTVLRPVVRSVNDSGHLLLEVAMCIALTDVLDHRIDVVIAA